MARLLRLLSVLPGSAEGFDRGGACCAIQFWRFALMGAKGIEHLRDLLRAAHQQGFYVLLDAPELLSPAAAK